MFPSFLLLSDSLFLYVSFFISPPIFIPLPLGFTKNIQFTCNHPTACGDTHSGMPKITVNAPLASDDMVRDGQRRCSVVMQAQPGCKFNFTDGNRLRLVVMDDESKCIACYNYPHVDFEHADPQLMYALHMTMCITKRSSSYCTSSPSSS